MKTGISVDLHPRHYSRCTLSEKPDYVVDVDPSFVDNWDRVLGEYDRVQDEMGKAADGVPLEARKEEPNTIGAAWLQCLGLSKKSANLVVQAHKDAIEAVTTQRGQLMGALMDVLAMCRPDAPNAAHRAWTAQEKARLTAAQRVVDQVVGG